MGDAICKAVFVSGSTAKAYGVDTANRILNLAHPEQEWNQTAQVLVDNSDKTLTALDLTGYTAVISYGYFTDVARSAWVANHGYSLGDFVIPTSANVNGYQYVCTTAGTSHATTEPTWLTVLGGTTTESTGVVWTLDGNDGDEYSACAPLEVIGQKDDTLMRAGKLVTAFSCAGVFNMMGEDEASEEYSPADTNTDTIGTILTAIAGATLDCFSHCKAYTVIFEGVSSPNYPLGYDDNIIDAFYPADYFHISFKESRLSAFRKALKWTTCKARIGADGAIHVFRPTTTGTTYNYEYNDALTYHNFFEKSVRNRLTVPNRVYVSSHPDHETQYSGSHADAVSYAALGRYMNEYHWIRSTGNTQCTNIATAIQHNHEIGQERGHGLAPMNCGQEVMDFVNITDSAAGDTRKGNIGYTNRLYRPGKFEFEFRFGALELGGVAGVTPPQISTTEEKVSMAALLDAYYQLADNLQIVINNQSVLVNNMELLWNREVVRKWHVTEQMIIPVWPKY